jgi:hypothetical protein
MSKKKTPEPEPVSVVRIRLRCPSCGWKGQRVATEDLGICPVENCGEPLDGPAPTGRPPLPVEMRRVEVRAYVMPSTLEALCINDEAPSQKAAELLDKWGKKHAVSP